MSTNIGKHFFIPDWLLKEGSQTIHAFIYIINKLENNNGYLKTNSSQLAKDLKLSRQQVRSVLKKITTNQTSNDKQIFNIPHKNDIILKIDFIELKKQSKKEEASEQPKAKTTIKERKEAFIEELAKYKDKYEKDMLNDFYRYWAETDKKEQKMRFEFQKTWSLNLRLATWHKNEQKRFDAQKKVEKPEELKIGRTSIETIKKNAEYHGKY
jgi:hypothetical protein